MSPTHKWFYAFMLDLKCCSSSVNQGGPPWIRTTCFIGTVLSQHRQREKYVEQKKLWDKQSRPDEYPNILMQTNYWNIIAHYDDQIKIYYAILDLNTGNEKHLIYK